MFSSWLDGHYYQRYAYGIVFAVLCLRSDCQVNIIGMPRSEQVVDLSIRDGGGHEIDATRPFGPVTVGQIVSMICDTRHPAVSHIAWFRDSVEIFGSITRYSDGRLENGLRFTVTPVDKLAEYKCRGLNLRHDVIIEKILNLDVLDAVQVPFTATIVSGNGTIKGNDTVTLRCLAQGSRGPAIITWWKEDRLMNESSVSALPGITVRNGVTTTESNLTFKVSITDHGLPIYCRAISALSQLHENNTAEAVFKLEVYQLPTAFITKNETIFSKENGPVSVICSLRANPPADKIRWYRNDKLIYEDKMKPAQAGPNEISTVSGGKNDVSTNSLRILQMSRGDIGSYTCEAHNIAGWSTRSNSVDVKLIQVKSGPVRTAKQQATTDIYAAEGEKLTLTCTVPDPTTPPASTFVWRKDGTFLTRGQTFVINPVQAKNFGSYTCAPYNGAVEGDAAAINLTRKAEEPILQTSETTVLMIASILGVVGGTILLAIVVWCLCLNKTCRRRNQDYKSKHLTSSTFTSGTYPSHTLPPLLPRPHLITPNHHHHSSTLSRENPLPRPNSCSKTLPHHFSASAIGIGGGVGGSGFIFGSSYTNKNMTNTTRPNYYPSWYSQRTERTNSYLGRNYKY